MDLYSGMQSIPNSGLPVRFIDPQAGSQIKLIATRVLIRSASLDASGVGAATSIDIPLDTGSVMALQRITGQSTGSYDIQVTNPTLENTTMFDQPADSRTVVGIGKRPGILPGYNMFPPRGVISIGLTNTSGASNQIELALWCIKVWAVPEKYRKAQLELFNTFGPSAIIPLVTFDPETGEPIRLISTRAFVKRFNFTQTSQTLYQSIRTDATGSWCMAKVTANFDDEFTFQMSNEKDGGTTMFDDFVSGNLIFGDAEYPATFPGINSYTPLTTLSMTLKNGTVTASNQVDLTFWGYKVHKVEPKYRALQAMLLSQIGHPSQSAFSMI